MGARKARLEARGYLLQARVAGLVSVVIVEQLEMIDIGNDHTQAGCESISDQRIDGLRGLLREWRHTRLRQTALGHLSDRRDHAGTAQGNVL